MSVMSAIVWYVVPGLLGRAYNIQNDTVGPDLFTREATQQAMTIERYVTTSEYKVVTETSEASDFLNMDGKLQLKLQTGKASLAASGKYLKDAKRFEKRVDILIKVTYETVTETLPPTAIQPMKDWQDMLRLTDMTHYIRSIKYGGQLIASVQFRTTSEEDKENIEAKVTGTLNAGSGSFGLNVTGQLEKIWEKVSKSSTIDINYYATVPIENIPRSIEGLSELVQKFPEQIKKIDKRGVPLQMEILSLQALERKLKPVSLSTAFNNQMELLNEELTDIRIARSRLAFWLKTIPPVLKKEENEKIGLFTTKLFNLEQLFIRTIDNLNLSPDASADQFEAAFEAYRDGREYIITDMYVRDIEKLQKEILDSIKYFETDFGGSYYIYWGSTTCPGTAKQLYSGVMSGNVNNAQGSAQFTCLPADTQFLPNNPSKDIDNDPTLQPLAFVSTRIDIDKKPVLANCSSCRVPGKSTATMLIGMESCPDRWLMEYVGILVSTGNREVRGEFACLDTSQPFTDVPDTLQDLAVITEVRPSCGAFPCKDPVKDQTAIKCVVCSFKKEAEKPSDFML